MEEVYKNADDMPISDILTEIRLLVSSETNMRYSRDRELAVSELLILRPEARVDLAIVDAKPTKPEPVKTKPTENIVKNTIGISSNEELRELIREIFQEELIRWSEN